ncbi:unnamed protein product [Musa textilis]
MAASRSCRFSNAPSSSLFSPSLPLSSASPSPCAAVSTASASSLGTGRALNPRSSSVLVPLALCFRSCELPVPVISVGNLTWGGNGKTPMVEFIARICVEAGIPPLILTRGYASGDEAKMLERHLSGTSARIGVGANRTAIAASIFERHGYMKFEHTLYSEKLSNPHKFGSASENGKVGVAILDDGMQHWSMLCDVEIVMLNGLMPWGNNHLIPRGSLREPLGALSRADIIVVHHADLVSDGQLKVIKSKMHTVDACHAVFFTRLAPSHFFEVKNQHSTLPLSVVINRVVLCVSAIGFPNAFVQAVGEIGPLLVDRLDFGDHHSIQLNVSIFFSSHCCCKYVSARFILSVAEELMT